MPESQTEQAVKPVNAAYVPASHSTQPLPLEEKYPAGQGVQEFEEKHDVPAAQKTVQVPAQSAKSSCNDAEVASSNRNLPEAHIVQKEAPTEAAYLPIGQTEQALDPAIAAYVPAEQTKH